MENNLTYNPDKLKREKKKFFISLTDNEISSMLSDLDLAKPEDLFAHIPDNIKFTNEEFEMGKPYSYDQLISHMKVLSQKNIINTSFIGDGLKSFKTPPLVNHVGDIRGLLTAYTPYQPERGQGTLISLYLYASLISELTGFEAINSSMYDRSTAIFEAINTALKLKRNKNTVLVASNIYPGDIEVLQTYTRGTDLKIKFIPSIKENGLSDLNKLNKLIRENKDNLAAIVFPHVNGFGNIEQVDELTDLARDNKLISIAIIDPMLLANGGLKPPSHFGSDKNGVDIIIGEGLQIIGSPLFGGPGLGIFGMRFNEKDKLSIRSAPGRLVGKGSDINGVDAWSIVLSTREQHIRRERASSNICSNQAFMATLAGAAILDRGNTGMSKAITSARVNALKIAETIFNLDGVHLTYPQTPFFNEFSITLENRSAGKLIDEAYKSDIELGIDISNRTGIKNSILLYFSDNHDETSINKLIHFLTINFKSNNNDNNKQHLALTSNMLRTGRCNLPEFSANELIKYYSQLGNLNVSPDSFIYPLGSCTMKYNPYINEYAAKLPGFSNIHPQAPLASIQGSLELIYQTQEMFKNMTGLSAVTTQPLAGAQGELTGLKMFQAYHSKNGEEDSRNIILIPNSAHGTNPATATMSGFETKRISGEKEGIILLSADNSGQIDFDDFKKTIDKYGTRIAGIMITNPNTSGIFELKFKKMTDMIHKVGGLVYMDGANMNAIAGHIDLNKMGVDAVHNNLHKTWAGPHGGGGPGAAIVAVSKTLEDFLPGPIIKKDENDLFNITYMPYSIGSMHRHYGNFTNIVRCYTYLLSLGTEGVKKMSEVATLSARYAYKSLKSIYPTLPKGAVDEIRMHEFILTISDDTFKRIEAAGVPKNQAIIKIGKLFLDFGIHAPTMAFPEVLGLMIEPTESYSKNELDHFNEIVKTIHMIINEHPEVLLTTPHFTPVAKIDEVAANKKIILSETITQLPTIPTNSHTPKNLDSLPVEEIYKLIIKRNQEIKN